MACPGEGPRAVSDAARSTVNCQQPPIIGGVFLNCTGLESIKGSKGGVLLPSKSMPVREAREIAQRIAAEMNVELVDAELVKEPTGHFLRCYIDKPDGIALDDLEAFHRRILPLVERVDYDYMEVSSPGADRPLKTERDFRRCQGTLVELKTYRPVNGGKQFTGELVGLEEGDVVIATEGGETLRFPLKGVAIVRPLIEFDEEDLQDDAPAETPSK